MPRVKVLKGRRATTVVEAHGEILFAPQGMVHRWTRALSNRITLATAHVAPNNKRPRWGHYGAPLKSSFTSTTRANMFKMRVYSAVGSRAPYAAYVDQGTGIYGGNGPYPAKVLPPWHQGSASLYEHTWRPGGPGERKVSPVMIKGQRGQGFFEEGLKRGFAAMRIPSVEGPAGARIGEVLDAMPTSLLSGPGNTTADTAFRASLREWRSWRDAAWERGEGLGRGGGIGSKAQEKFRRQAARSKPDRTRKTHSSPSAPSKPTKPAVNRESRKVDRANFIKAMTKKYGKIELHSVRYDDGYWYATVWEKDDRGKPKFREVRAKAKT